MTDTNVKIRAKGCANTGVTDELATKLYSNKGGRIMAIVELKVDETHEKADGDRKVDLVITELEPVVDGKLNGRLDEHVRTIQAALYRNRALLQNGGETLPFEEGGEEPTVEGVLAAGRALVDVDEDGNPELWDGEDDPGESGGLDDLDDTDEGDEDEDLPQQHPDEELEDDEQRPATNPFTIVTP